MPVPEWQTVCCPGTVRFSRIQKERQTLARIYCLCHPGAEVWLSQSLPPLVKRARQYYSRVLHCSSCYRIIRGESRTDAHYGFVAKRFETAEEVNQYLDEAQVQWLIVVLRDPDLWETLEAAEEESEERVKEDAAGA